jgi:isocitrate dehydrogenase kinase/phosphatase
MFVRPAISTEHIESDPPSYRSYYPVQGGLRATFRQIAADFGFKRPVADFERDFRYLLHAVRERFPRPFVAEANHQIQMLSAPFFRNKGAYLVGKIINGNHDYPFSVAMLHDANGKLYLDTILLERSQLEVLFSFARAYFMVDMEVPSAYVRFLQTLLPDKPVAEIYTMLGLQKHGKTLFYREFLHHLKHSSDNFIVAPGIRGMVMAVFTLPSYPYVFKVIRDVISPPKEVTKEKVREQYQLVKQHDRVGRMADTLEFSNVALPRARFGAELLEELRTLASSEIEEEGDTLIIKHVYIERRMVPLNICLDGADDERLRHCIFDFGNAIKQLATANIFPGDMLFKNFGVTRHDRIVFYDYDEISYMTGCNFRRVPQAQTPEQELAAEPWYTVGPHDIFPEEFSHFWFGTPQIREHFLTYHAYLLDPKFWQDTQRKIAAGHIEDVFPYGEKARFHRRFGKPATQSGMSQ